MEKKIQDMPDTIDIFIRMYDEERDYCFLAPINGKFQKLIKDFFFSESNYLLPIYAYFFLLIFHSLNI